jgi:hypothetical protein
MGGRSSLDIACALPYVLKARRIIGRFTHPVNLKLRGVGLGGVSACEKSPVTGPICPKADSAFTLFCDYAIMLS